MSSHSTIRTVLLSEFHTFHLTVMFRDLIVLSEGGQTAVKGIVACGRWHGAGHIVVSLPVVTHISLQVAEVYVGKDGGNDKRNDSFSPLQ